MRGIVRPRAITDRRDRPQHVGELRDLRIEDHARAPRREIHFGDGNSGTLQKPPLDKPDAGAAMDAFEDRKSTRLNSSHMSISYAVFCLKKKKKKIKHTITNTT